MWSKVKEYLVASVATSKELYIFTIVGIDVEFGAKNAKVLELYTVGQNFNSIGKGKIYNAVVDNLFTKGALAAYRNNRNLNDDDSDNPFFGPKEIEEIFIKITAMNREKQLISGKFNFKGIKETGVFYEVTDGKFKNIAYEIQKNQFIIYLKYPKII